MTDLIITERSNMVVLANAVRNKTGQTEELTLGEIVTSINDISGAEIKNQDITITENGTYTPASGFTGFGSVKVEVESSGGGSTEEWIGDGNTHIWITLNEGRTSPTLGVCPNGTVTVDWGDGTAPDTLTGTSTSAVKWTPTHNYAEHGDYVITLTVDGEMGLRGNSAGSYILRYTQNDDSRGTTYQNAVKKIELGDGVTSIGYHAFDGCYSLTSVVIPNSVTSIGVEAFYCCYALASVVIPDSVTSIGNHAFGTCYSLTSVVIPDSVTSIKNGAFYECRSLASVVIPNSVTSIEGYTFYKCYALASVVIPDSVTSIGECAFNYCYSLASATISNSVTRIENNTFQGCSSIRYYDFAHHTAVPTLASSRALEVPLDCEIRVPAALYDEWIATTNWTTHEYKIVGV